VDVPQTPALTGCRVLDFSVTLPGPLASTYLAEMGADVLVVHPPTGDPVETIRPALVEAVTWNKRVARVDLKSADQRAAVRELAASADVLIQAFRPGVMSRFGLGYDDLRADNPGLVYCSLSGFGQDGPMADVPAHDLNILGLVGAINPPVGSSSMGAPTLPIGDLSSSMHIVIGALSGLLARTASGLGRHVDIAIADSLLAWMGPTLRLSQHGHTFALAMPEYRAYRCQDGRWLTLGISFEDHFWKRLSQVLDLPTEIARMSVDERLAHNDELVPKFEAIFASRLREDWLSALVPAGVPAAVLNSPEEVIADIRFRERGVLKELDGGPISTPGRVLGTDFPPHRAVPGELAWLTPSRT
jgi:crotonobetainyl-CoA:carnitine CoA-transferase CaiB-like acyl-CoA transferase